MMPRAKKSRRRAGDGGETLENGNLAVHRRRGELPFRRIKSVGCMRKQDDSLAIPD
jgi:hypothetical protein